MLHGTYTIDYYSSHFLENTHMKQKSGEDFRDICLGICWSHLSVGNLSPTSGPCQKDKQGCDQVCNM